MSRNIVSETITAFEFRRPQTDEIYALELNKRSSGDHELHINMLYPEEVCRSPKVLRDKTIKTVAGMALETPGEEVSMETLKSEGVINAPAVSAAVDRLNSYWVFEDNKLWSKKIEVSNEKYGRNTIRSIGFVGMVIGGKASDAKDTLASGVLKNGKLDEEPTSVDGLNRLELDAKLWIEQRKEEGLLFIKRNNLEGWAATDVVILDLLSSEGKKGVTIPEISEMIADRYPNLKQQISEDTIIGRLLGIVQVINNSQMQNVHRIKLQHNQKDPSDIKNARFFWKRNKSF